MTVAEVRNQDDLWAWMNTWGDLLERHEGRSREWKKGYQKALMDLMRCLGEMGVDSCSDEAWRRFTGRANASSDK